METVVLEYIWIGGNGELRSKTRVVQSQYIRNMTIADIPKWNYDGSSTGQASSEENTEVVLCPVDFFRDPFRPNNGLLVLCDILDAQGNPIGHREKALTLFERGVHEVPWFGLEQEYFIMKNEPIPEEQGSHYCGVGTCGRIDRMIVEKHLEYCLFAELNISGINAEVASGQWEFQIGPNVGINAADELYIARYLLQRTAEKYDCRIVYTPKLISTINGSGCHVNFSTLRTRSEGGINVIINEYIPKLEAHHQEDVVAMGEGNERRLTGHHETSSMDRFTCGIGTRNTSVRIGNETFKQGCGYFEDRRPAANLEPYTVTSLLFKRCCLE
jgi:glutamine synthetase